MPAKRASPHPSSLITEANFTHTVIELARYCGWHCAHFRPALVRSGKWVTPVSGDKGSPDLLLARGGVVILAELKSQKGRLGPGQAEWASELGAHYRLWRPSDIEEIKRELK